MMIFYDADGVRHEVSRAYVANANGRVLYRVGFRDRRRSRRHRQNRYARPSPSALELRLLEDAIFTDALKRLEFLQMIAELGSVRSALLHAWREKKWRPFQGRVVVNPYQT